MKQNIFKIIDILFVILVLVITFFLIFYSINKTKKVLIDFKKRVAVLEESDALIARKGLYEKKKNLLNSILSKQQKKILIFSNNSEIAEKILKEFDLILEKNNFIEIISKETLPINDLMNGFLEIKLKVLFKCSINDLINFLYLVEKESNIFDVNEIYINNNSEKNICCEALLVSIVRKN